MPKRADGSRVPGSWAPGIGGPFPNGGGEGYMNDDLFFRILETRRATGQAAIACEAHGATYSAVKTYMETRKHLREDWRRALEQWREDLEVEAYDRAINGVEKPVFYKGMIVGYVVEKSDRLLERLLEAHHPRYRIVIDEGTGDGDGEADDLSTLTADEMDELRSNLRQIVSRREGVADAEDATFEEVPADAD